jgi:hypothetical protein
VLRWGMWFSLRKFRIAKRAWSHVWTACDASRPLTLEEMVTNAHRDSGRPSAELESEGQIVEALCGEGRFVAAEKEQKANAALSKFESRGTRPRLG